MSAKHAAKFVFDKKKKIIAGSIAGALVVVVCAILIAINTSGKTFVSIVDNLEVTDGTFEAGTELQVSEYNDLYYQTTVDGKTYYVLRSAVVTEAQAAAAAAEQNARKASNRVVTIDEINSLEAGTGLSDTGSGQDGGTITLSSATIDIFNLFEPTVAYADEQSAETARTEKATVGESGATKIVGFVERGADLRVVETLDDGTYKVKVGNITGYVSQNFVREKGTTAPAAETRFAALSASLYSNYQLTTLVRALNPNELMNIVDVAGDVVLVEVDGVVYYALANETSATEVEIPTYSAPAANSTASTASSAQSTSNTTSSADDNNNEANWSKPTL